MAVCFKICCGNLISSHFSGGSQSVKDQTSCSEVMRVICSLPHESGMWFTQGQTETLDVMSSTHFVCSVIQASIHHVLIQLQSKQFSHAVSGLLLNLSNTVSVTVRHMGPGPRGWRRSCDTTVCDYFPLESLCLSSGFIMLHFVSDDCMGIKILIYCKVQFVSCFLYSIKDT